MGYSALFRALHPELYENTEVKIQIIVIIYFHYDQTAGKFVWIMLNSYLTKEYERRKPLSCTLNTIIIGIMDVIIY